MKVFGVTGFQGLGMVFCVAFFACTAHAQQPSPRAPEVQGLRIAGSPSVSFPVKDAAAILKKDQNLILQIYPEIASTPDKIAALGYNKIDVAMSAQRLKGSDRAPFPDIVFTEVWIGQEAGVLAVSEDVWNSGLRSLTREQALAIYEGKIKNWKLVGGPDAAIVQFTPETMHGVWACYIQWIYDDTTKMQPDRFTGVKDDEEAKTSLQSTAGSLAPVSLVFAEENHLHVLAIKNSADKVIEPSAATVANGSYKMSRPLLLVSKGRPLGDMRTFLNFMLGDQGQELVHKYNCLTLKDLGVTPEMF